MDFYSLVGEVKYLGKEGVGRSLTALTEVLQ
jgi:hypothetical protein